MYQSAYNHIGSYIVIFSKSYELCAYMLYIHQYSYKMFNIYRGISLKWYKSLGGQNQNPVIHFALQLAMGPNKGLLHISTSMIVFFSYLLLNSPLLYCTCTKNRILMCFTLGVTSLALDTEIQLVLSSRCTVFAAMGIPRDSVYCHIDLLFLEFLQSHLISTSVESESTSG